jgi:hypothetical protein
MQCPFCGEEMQPGWVRVGGFFLYPAVCTVLWESTSVPRTVKRLARGSGGRGARSCPSCGAVVVDPDPA